MTNIRSAWVQLRQKRLAVILIPVLVLIVALGVVALSPVGSNLSQWVAVHITHRAVVIDRTEDNKTVDVHVGDTIIFSMDVGQVTVSDDKVLKPLVKATRYTDPSGISYNVQGQLKFQVVSPGSETVSADVGGDCSGLYFCFGVFQVTLSAVK